MSFSFRFQKIRLVVPLVLLVMILMRLVWVNLRFYQPEVTLPAGLAAFALSDQDPDSCSEQTWRRLVSGNDAAADWNGDRQAIREMVSPGLHWLTESLCRLPEFAAGIDLDMLLKWNQWLLLSTVFLGVLLGRFLTSSWNMALIGGVVLLSRGSYLNEISIVGGSIPLSFAMMFWFTAVVHHLRTGSILSGALAVAAGTLATLLDPSQLSLLMALPLLVGLILLLRPLLIKPSAQRLRELRFHMNSLAEAPLPPSLAGRMALTFQWLLGPIRNEAKSEAPWQPNLKAGWVFRTIDVPYGVWIMKSGRGIRLLRWWALTFLAVAALTASAYWPWVQGFGQAMSEGALVALGGSVAATVRGFGSHLDLHYTASLIVLLVCALQYPADGLLSVQEAVWSLLLAMLIAVVLSGSVAVLHQQSIQPLQDLVASDTFANITIGQRLSYWFEPLVLILGVAGVYHLVKVGDTKRLRRLMRQGR